MSSLICYNYIDNRDKHITVNIRMEMPVFYFFLEWIGKTYIFTLHMNIEALRSLHTCSPSVSFAFLHSSINSCRDICVAKLTTCSVMYQYVTICS